MQRLRLRGGHGVIADDLIRYDRVIGGERRVGRQKVRSGIRDAVADRCDRQAVDQGGRMQMLAQGLGIPQVGHRNIDDLHFLDVALIRLQRRLVGGQVRRGILQIELEVRRMIGQHGHHLVNRGAHHIHKVGRAGVRGVQQTNQPRFIRLRKRIERTGIHVEIHAGGVGHHDLADIGEVLGNFRSAAVQVNLDIAGGIADTQQRGNPE